MSAVFNKNPNNIGKIVGESLLRTVYLINKRNREKITEGVTGLDNHLFKFFGRSDVDKKLTRTLEMSGAQGDTYMVEGMVEEDMMIE